MKTRSDIRIRNSRFRSYRVLAAGATAIFCAPFALLPASGGAQSLDPAGLHELDDDRTDITHENLTIDEIEDMNVVRDGEVIGEVEEVLGNEDDEIVALVIEYGDNLVGIGGRDVIVPIDKVEFPPGRNHVETTMTDAELAQLTRWER